MQQLATPQSRRAQRVPRQTQSNRAVRSNALSPSGLQIQRQEENGATGPNRPPGSTLPYREATELHRCIEIMGEENASHCYDEVVNRGLPPVHEGPAPLGLSSRHITHEPSSNGEACACLVFIHNEERNARAAAEDLHSRCRYNLAIVNDGRTRPVNIPDTGPRDPNELFPHTIQEECTRDERSCRAYALTHNDLRAAQIEFFLAIKSCSANFTLPTIALHNNRINDTNRFRPALPRLGSRVDSLRGDFTREPATGTGSREDLRGRLDSLNRRFRRMMVAGGTTNIFRWCNLPEIGRCHVGNPQQPDHVVWTTRLADFTTLSRLDVNVVLQEGVAGAAAAGSESETDLSTLFLRAGANARYINIETPHTRPGRADGAAMQRSNLDSIEQVLRGLGLDCCG